MRYVETDVLTVLICIFIVICILGHVIIYVFNQSVSPYVETVVF